MAVGNGKGTFGVPEGLRGVVDAPGFAFVAHGIAQWNAPGSAREPAAPSERDRARDERKQAEQTIEKSLDTIRAALVNPNLTDAQRNELVNQQAQLEGLKTQLSNGAAGSVQQAVSTAQHIAGSVMATVASASGASISSVLRNGGYIGSDGVVYNAGGSYNALANAPAFHSALADVRNGGAFTNPTLVAAHRQFYSTDSQYRATIDRVIQRSDDRVQQSRSDAQDLDATAQRLGIQNKELEDAAAKAQREYDRERAANPNSPRVLQLEEQMHAARQSLNTFRADQARSQGNDADAAKFSAGAGRNGSNRDNARTDVDAATQALGDAHRRQERAQERQLQPNITPERRAGEADALRVGNRDQMRENRRIGDALVINNSTVIQSHVADRMEAASTLPRGGAQVGAASVFRVTENAPASLAAAEEAETRQADAAQPVAPTTAQQVAETDKAKEAAKPLAQNNSQSAEAKPGQTEAPRTQTAAANTQTPTTGRAS